MSQSTQTSTSYRYANEDERFHAHHALLSLGEEFLAKVVEQTGWPEDVQPIVVTDFSEVGDHQILLVPGGRHEIPAKLLRGRHIFIGLPSKETPALILSDGPEEEIWNHAKDTVAKFPVFDCEMCKFAKLAFDARKPTIVRHCFFESHAFSDYFFQVECGKNVELMDNRTDILYNGQAWALEALAPTYRSRNTVERGLDGFHNNTIGLIDSIFQPLLNVAQRIDAALGWK